MLTDIKRLNELLEVNRDLNSTLDQDQLLDIILERATRALDAEASSIVLIDNDDRLIFLSAYGEKRLEIKKIALRRGEGIVGWVIEHNKPALVVDPEKDERFNEEISKELGFPNNTIMCVPLVIDSKVMGAIEVINCKSKAVFDGDDLDYITEFSHQVAIALKNATIFGQMNTEMDELKTIFDLKHEIVGTSRCILGVLGMVKKVAPKEIIVLITGRSGTGKELVARAIHDNSPRRHNPFVSVNCAAIPDDLLESELFGHEKGAFTGAATSRKGKFEMADRGTLFLDEIGDMSLRAQAKVLRAIQDQIIQRVGGNREIKVNTRIIAATNKDLVDEIRSGKFREDLYYRLNEISIEIPPLEERKEDIPILVDHFIKMFNLSMKKNIKGISREALRKLFARSWDGNVRELKNFIKRAMVFAEGDSIIAEDFEPGFDTLEGDESGAMNHALASGFGADGLPLSLAEIERHHIERALQFTGWNKSRACEILDINRPRLDRKIKTYGLAQDGNPAQKSGRGNDSPSCGKGLASSGNSVEDEAHSEE